MDLTFNEHLSWRRSRIMALDQRVASDEVGPSLVGLVGEVVKEQRAFLARWRDQDAQSRLAGVASTIADAERHDEVLYLLNLIILLETRWLAHVVGVNDCFAEMVKIAEEHASGGQQTLDQVSGFAASQALLAEANAELERGFNDLKANWPAKVGMEHEYRMIGFEEEGFVEWNTESLEQLVKLCLESNFTPTERTKALQMINRLGT